jgi:hypothetical protein
VVERARVSGGMAGARRVVQTDVFGNNAFIPEPTPGNTSMDTPGIKRLPGMDDFERLRGARRRTSR